MKRPIGVLAAILVHCLWIAGALVGAVIDVVRARPYWVAMALFGVLWSAMGLWLILERHSWARVFNAAFFGGMAAIGLAALWAIPAGRMPRYWPMLGVFGIFGWIGISMVASRPIARYFEERRVPEA